MRRFWFQTENEIQSGQLLEVKGDLFHHIVEVCRFEEGDQFEFLVEGLAWRVEVETLAKKNLVCRVLDSRALPEISGPHIHVVLAMPRPAKVDWIVEKFVELGVHTLHLATSEYSFLRKVSEISANKHERWQKLILAATQQSGRGDLMTLTTPRNLDDIIANFNPDPSRLGLMAYEAEGFPHLREVLRGAASRKYKEIWVLVGSEGGFSAAEVARAVRQGFQGLTLGEQVLRVETACVALASILKYEFADSSI